MPLLFYIIKKKFAKVGLGKLDMLKCTFTINNRGDICIDALLNRELEQEKKSSIESAKGDLTFNNLL